MILNLAVKTVSDSKPSLPFTNTSPSYHPANVWPSFDGVLRSTLTFSSTTSSSNTVPSSNFKVTVYSLGLL